MNIIEDYQKKAIMGFDGSNFLQATYHGNKYFAILDDCILLLSEEKIDINSEFEDDMYITEVCIQDLEELEQCKMFAVYKGNEYSVQIVSSGLESMELLIRKGFEKEDYELGFTDNIYERVTDKFVNISEIEGIRVEKKSVYQDYV